MAITKRSDDYSQWYLDIIKEAKLADYSPVKGCMIIRPNGYAIWETLSSQRQMLGLRRRTGTGKCIVSGKEATKKAIIGKSY